MAQGQIDNLLSKEALQSFVDLRVLVDGNVTSLEKLISRAVDLNKSIGGNIGFKQFNDQIKAIEVNEKALADQTVNLASAQGKLTSTIESYSRTISSNIDAQKEVARVVKDSVDNSVKEARARKLNADAMLTEAKAAQVLAKAKQDIPTEIVPTFISNNTADNAKVGTVVNDGQTAALNEQLAAQAALNTEINASTAARSGANAQTAKAVVLEEQLAKSEIQLEAAQSDNNVHLQENKILTKEATDLAKRQALENLGLLGAYDKLVLEYKEASVAAKDLAVAQGAGSVEAKAAAANALALGERIKSIDQSVGQSQKNVGNYASAFGKAFGTIRQLAYILPGIGIAGIFSAIFEGLTQALSQLNIFGSKTTEINDSIADSFRKGSDSALKEAADLQILYRITQDTTVSLSERKKATSELLEINDKNNKNTGESNKLLIDQNGLLTAQPELLDKISDSLIRQAKTKAIVGELEKAYSELLATETASLFDNFKNLNLIDEAGVILKSAFSGPGLAGATIGLNTISKSTTNALEKIKNLQEFLTKGIQDGSLSFNGVFKPGEDLSGYIAKIKAEGIEELKFQSDLQKKLSEVQSLELQTRLNARAQASIDEELIANKEYQAELFNINSKFSNSKKTIKDAAEKNEALLQISNKYGNELISIARKQEEDIISIRQSAIAHQKDLDKKANDDALAAFADANSKRLKAIQDQSASQQTNLAGGKDIEVEALNRKYDAQYKAAGDNQKKITALDLKYAVERGNIEFEYAKNSLKDQISTAEELIQFEKDNNQSTLSEEEKLSKAKQDLSDLELKHALENNEKRRQSEKQTLADIQKGIEFVQDIGDRVLSIIGGLVDANVTRIKNSLQDQSDQIDKNTAKEISAAEASGDTAQNKANRIAVINAKAQAQKDLLDIKQRQADEKKARFDKAQTIFGIITKTALAVVSFLAQTNFIGAQLAAVLGAAELAVAIAAPLPRYKGGTWDHLGTDAIVGDGGKRELVIEPSGKMYATPDVPTVMNLPKHSIVLPDLQKVLENGIMSPWRGGSVMKNNDEELLKGIKREIVLLRKSSGARQVNEKVGHRGFTSLVRFGNNWNTYIEEQINF